MKINQGYPVEVERIRKTKIINLFGGPGSGKSATAFGLCYHLKLKNIDVEFVPEYAKALLWSDRLLSMQDQQEYIFAKQNHLLHHLNGKVDFVITDSPTLLSYIYTANSKTPWTARDAFKAFVLASYKTYDNVNILLKRPEHYNSTGRLQNEEQAKEIDADIEHALDMLNVDIIKVPTNEFTVGKIIDNYLYL